MSKVWVECNPNGRAIRIFRNKKAAALYYLQPSHGLNQLFICEMERAHAVADIRRAVFARDNFTCVKCGKMVNWDTGEMDEVQARGSCVRTQDGNYHSGEVSVANGQTLCHECHTGRGGKHDRAPNFAKSLPGKSPIQLANAAIQGALSFAGQYKKHRDNQ